MTTEADSYELLPEGDQTKRGGASFIDTVERPDAVTAAASMDRLKLTDDGIGCVALAVDTAETIQAQNSIEKMLAHQLAAAHKLAMTFAGKAQRLIEEDGSGWNSQPTIYAAEGIERIRKSRWKHGLRSAEAIRRRKGGGVATERDQTAG
jgi:hypothetical protein